MSEYVDLEAELIRQTDKAGLFDVDGEEVWIPFSQIEDNGEDMRDGYDGPIWVTRWFAEKEGLA